MFVCLWITQGYIFFTQEDTEQPWTIKNKQHKQNQSDNNTALWYFLVAYMFCQLHSYSSHV